MGCQVKLTTNGQFNATELDDLLAAGLAGMNFSVHSLNPERFLRLQEGRGVIWQQNGKRAHRSDQAIPDSRFKVISQLDGARVEWAYTAIEKQLYNLLAAKEHGIAVKINTVLSTDDDLPNAQEIIAWAKLHGVGVRLLNDLSNSTESEQVVLRLLGLLHAEYIQTMFSPVSSSYSDQYRIKDGYEIAFKRIRKLILAKTACRTCLRTREGTCEEGFYGIRLQVHQGMLYVLLCIQEINEQTIMPMKDFLASSQIREIQELLITP